MKKSLCLLLLCLLLCQLCACGAAPETEAPTQSVQRSCDVDLDDLNQALRYSGVNDILQNPENYVGKTIKVTGYFYIYEADIRNVYACLVPDPTECCASGLEFRLAGEHAFPDDYPPADTEITVIGTLGTYSDDEGENYAYELQNAELVS